MLPSCRAFPPWLLSQGDLRQSEAALCLEVLVEAMVG